jgi:hypothetical protein
MKVSHIVIALFICLSVIPAEKVKAELEDASSFECGNGIISIGDTVYDLIETCGKPTYEENYGRILVYDFGPTEFICYITIEDSKVERIQFGGYGSIKKE